MSLSKRKWHERRHIYYVWILLEDISCDTKNDKWYSHKCNRVKIEASFEF